MHKPAKVLQLSLLVLVTVYVVNFGFLAFLIGPFDYDHLSGYWELAWRFWRTSPGLPHYDPYLCGGRTLGADPQLPIFHPLLLLVPILGATVLVKWEMLAQLSAGAWGLLGMTRHLGISSEGKRWALFLYLAGGAVVARFLVGHVTLGFFFLYPLFIYLSYRGARLPYYGLFLYASLYKPNFLIYAVPALLVEASARAVAQRQPRIFVDCIIGVTLGAFGGAVSLIPSWRYFAQFPRVDGTQPLLVPFYAFIANLLLPLKAIPKAFYGDGFLQRHEYNLFLGPAALLYAWKGRLPLSAEWRALAILGIFSLWMGFGAPTAHFSPLWIYSWFRPWWPGFASIRVPTRFWYGTFLALILFSARGFCLPKTRGTFIAWLGIGVLPLLLSAAINLSKPSVLATETEWSAASRGGRLSGVGQPTAVILAALLIVNPVGLWLTWNGTSFDRRTKLLLSSVSVLWYLGVAGLVFAQTAAGCPVLQTTRSWFSRRR